MDIIKKIIINNELSIEALIDCYRSDDSEEFCRKLAKLHNGKGINLIELFEKVDFESGATKIYSYYSIVSKTISLLDITVSEAIFTLENHKAKYQYFDKIGCYSNFLLANEHRVSQSLELCLQNPLLYIDFLCCTLLLGAKFDPDNYHGYCMELLSHESEDIQHRIVYILGDIVSAERQDLIIQSQRKLRSLTNQVHTEELAASILKSAIQNSIKSHETIASALEIIHYLFEHRVGNSLPNQAALSLSWELENISVEIQDVLFTKIIDLNLFEGSTLELIDLCLEKLLIINRDQAISYIEMILLRNISYFNISNFRFVTSSLLTDPTLLNSALTKWLCSNNITLNRICRDFLDDQGRDNLFFSVDERELSKSGLSTFSLASRATGWLIIHPLAAIHFILSAISLSSKNEIDEIANLINFLLLNYPGCVHDQLSKVVLETRDNTTKELLKKLLKVNEQNFSWSTDIYSYSELLPSEQQRETHYRKRSREMNSSMAAAEEKSIFGSICSRVTLLYGRKSINQVVSSDGALSRSENFLAPFSYSVELPRIERVDPIGFQNLIMSFCFEGHKIENNR